MVNYNVWEPSSPRQPRRSTDREEMKRGFWRGTKLAAATLALLMAGGVFGQRVAAEQEGVPHDSISADVIDQIQYLNELVDDPFGSSDESTVAAEDPAVNEEPGSTGEDEDENQTAPENQEKPEEKQDDPGPSKAERKQVSGKLPPKIVGAYWQMYQGPHVSEITKEAPEYNLQLAAFALGNGSGGTVTFNPPGEFGETFQADMRESQEKGCTWLLSLGGGVPDQQKIILNEQAHADQLIESLGPIIEKYGFQGIDFDLENGPGGWKPEVMAYAAKQLKQKYGKDFVISMVPRPYENYYFETAALMGDELDLFMLQFYDNEITDDPSKLREWIHQRVEVAINQYKIPPSKIVIGAITYHPEYHMGSNSIEVYAEIFKELEAKYSKFRGVVLWETSLDKKKSTPESTYPFAEKMHKVVVE